MLYTPASEDALNFLLLFSQTLKLYFPHSLAMSEYSANNQKPIVEELERTRSSEYVPGRHGSAYEKVFLAPELPVAGGLAKILANPTPIALGGFLLANTPATIDLMGWTGAGAGTGNAAAGTASYYFYGGLLLLFGGIGEFIIGNTFPATVFFTFAGFWFTFGGTLTPFYAAISSYTTPSGQPDPAGFYDSFAYFLIWMGMRSSRSPPLGSQILIRLSTAVLCLIYMVAALRTNVILVFVLFTFVVAFPFLAASYFAGAAGHASKSKNCRVTGGAFAFIGSMAAWYLFISMILESVDFPISLPVGDLSTRFKGKTQRTQERSSQV